MVAPLLGLAALWHRLGPRSRALLRGREVTVLGRRLHTTTLLTGALITIAVGILVWATNGLVTMLSLVPTGVLARWQENLTVLSDTGLQIAIIAGLGALALGPVVVGGPPPHREQHGPGREEMRRRAPARPAAGALAACEADTPAATKNPSPAPEIDIDPAPTVLGERAELVDPTTLRLTLEMTVMLVVNPGWNTRQELDGIFLGLDDSGDRLRFTALNPARHRPVGRAASPRPRRLRPLPHGRRARRRRPHRPRVGRGGGADRDRV